MNLALTTRIKATVREGSRIVAEAETTNFFTELGEAYLADRLSDRSETDGDIDAIAIGTGSGRNRQSTTLAGEVARSSSITPTQGAGADDNDAIWAATFAAGTPASDQTITEGALFSKITSAGTMINYFEFSPGILKTTAQSLTITVTVTVGSS
jgi:hypothetical protein